jgi:hypothetical protein
MITAAGLDWRVHKVAPTFSAVLDNEGRKAGEMALRALDHVALVRSDNGSVLGTAKRGYEVFDNAEMFRFLDSFATDGLRYHTAGALFNGERVWALASLEGSNVTVRRGRYARHAGELPAVRGVMRGDPASARQREVAGFACAGRDLGGRSSGRAWSRGAMMAAMLRLGLILLVVLGARVAWASPILTGSVADARLCADPACETVTMTLESERPAPGPVTGTLDIDPAALRIEFDLVLESAVLRGSDGIWTGLELRDVRFHGAGTLDRLPVRVRFNVWAINGTAQVDGSAVGISPLAESTVISFSATPALGGICRQIRGIGCTIAFGPGEFVIPSAGGRYLSISLAASVPEPAALVLAALGIAALAGSRLTWLFG